MNESKLEAIKKLSDFINVNAFDKYEREYLHDCLSILER